MKTQQSHAKGAIYRYRYISIECVGVGVYLCVLCLSSHYIWHDRKHRGNLYSKMCHHSSCKQCNLQHIPNNMATPPQLGGFSFTMTRQRHWKGNYISCLLSFIKVMHFAIKKTESKQIPYLFNMTCLYI